MRLAGSWLFLQECCPWYQGSRRGELHFILIICTALVWQGFGSQGVIGVDSVRSCWTFPLPEEPVPAGPKVDHHCFAKTVCILSHEPLVTLPVPYPASRQRGAVVGTWHPDKANPPQLRKHTYNLRQ